VARALIVTYHAVEPGDSPLCLDAELFGAHADAIAESGRRSVTVSGLADLLRAGALDEDVVAITFDDGFASVADTAAPLLLDRGLTATVFCVAGHLGLLNDWQSARARGHRSRLADAETLSGLAQAGFEIGSHGIDHSPLATASEDVAGREVVDSQIALEQALGVRVTSFAYPYGATPGPAIRGLVEATYEAACTTRLGQVSATSNPHALPRVDAHYLRRPELLRRALREGLGGTLRARGLVARARRTLVKDYVAVEAAPSPRPSLSE
jgi:peptidoglycan/xylan/chitin deacetylase (PgdA/CDA1 family)